MDRDRRPDEEARMREVLLTFVGYHDPYYKSAVEGEELKGPILYLLGLRGFDAVCLFSAPNTIGIANDTARAISSAHPQTAAQVLTLPIEDPINYGQIIREVKKAFQRIRRENPFSEYFIATASGTPQMHASWLMLAASGQIPARILQARPPQFVTAERQAVEEIDLRPNVEADREGAEGITDYSPASGAQESGVLMDMGEPSVHMLSRLEAFAASELPLPQERVRKELGIIGSHPLFESAMETASLLACHPTPVLVSGETGTGKELLAAFIHRMSGRPADRLVAVNCAAIPEPLAESHLFGHRKGAFTGATETLPGKFLEADRGTLFLDEIGELPDKVQAKLLRVLQDGIVEPVGGTKGRKVNVRIIAGTNRDLRAEMNDGRFRKDLYFRIEVGIVRIPALRERKSDIPLLAIGLLENLNLHLRSRKRLSQQAIDALVAREWPGNVRDLRNTLERTVILRRGEVIEPEDLQFVDGAGGPLRGGTAAGGPGGGAGIPEPSEGFRLEDFLGDARRRLIERALEKANGNKTAAARLLGITPQAIHNFLRRGSDDAGSG
jgi:DNA-binding NtrC family response regulator